MYFKKIKPAEKNGERIGFLFSYFLFTTILFFLLVLLNKLPTSWSYLHIVGITVLIVLCGLGLERVLK